MTTVIGYLPVLEFSNGDGEDLLVAWQIRYADVADFFDGATYKLNLANAAGLSGIAFSSESDVNQIQVTTIVDPDDSTKTLANITLKAPWRSLFGMAGKRSGNLQIKRFNGAIHDLALVQGLVAKRPTYSEPLPQ